VTRPRLQRDQLSELVLKSRLLHQECYVRISVTYVVHMSGAHHKILSVMYSMFSRSGPFPSIERLPGDRRGLIFM
jgi:hypothetical protein